MFRTQVFFKPIWLLATARGRRNEADQQHQSKKSLHEDFFPQVFISKNSANRREFLCLFFEEK